MDIKNPENELKKNSFLYSTGISNERAEKGGILIKERS